MCYHWSIVVQLNVLNIFSVFFDIVVCVCSVFPGVLMLVVTQTSFYLYTHITVLTNRLCCDGSSTHAVMVHPLVL